MPRVVSMAFEAPPFALTLNSRFPLSTPMYWVRPWNGRFVTMVVVSSVRLIEAASGIAFMTLMLVLPLPLPVWPQAASVNASRQEKKATADREFIDVSKDLSSGSGGLYVRRRGTGNAKLTNLSIIGNHHALQRREGADDVHAVGLARDDGRARDLQDAVGRSGKVEVELVARVS